MIFANVARKIFRGCRSQVSQRWENLLVLLGMGFPLAFETKRNPPKIAMAVMAHERPDLLRICLDSIYRSRLQSYDFTLLIQDDGSLDPAVREVIERPAPAGLKVVRSFTPKGPNCWGGAFNKAMRKLLELDDFDIIGTCDSDVVFNADWLDRTMEVALWAKKHHRRHVIGPFSSFNSSDFVFHQVLGTYHSPFGKYLIKKRMGAVNYFYFKEDFEKLGYASECRDDETLLTERFERLGVRQLCTETSYVEHLGGDTSILDQWRPKAVKDIAAHARNPAKDGWPSLN